MLRGVYFETFEKNFNKALYCYKLAIEKFEKLAEHSDSLRFLDLFLLIPSNASDKYQLKIKSKLYEDALCICNQFSKSCLEHKYKILTHLGEINFKYSIEKAIEYLEEAILLILKNNIVFSNHTSRSFRILAICYLEKLKPFESYNLMNDKYIFYPLYYCFAAAAASHCGGSKTEDDMNDYLLRNISGHRLFKKCCSILKDGPKSLNAMLYLYKKLSDFYLFELNQSGNFDLVDRIVAWSKASISLKPNPKAYYKLGYCYSLQNNLLQAEEAFKEGLNISPNAPNINAQYGHFLAFNGCYIEAIEKSIQTLQFEEAEITYSKHSFKHVLPNIKNLIRASNNQLIKLSTRGLAFHVLIFCHDKLNNIDEKNNFNNQFKAWINNLSSDKKMIYLKLLYENTPVGYRALNTNSKNYNLNFHRQPTNSSSFIDESNLTAELNTLTSSSDDEEQSKTHTF